MTIHLRSDFGHPRGQSGGAEIHGDSDCDGGRGGTGRVQAGVLSRVLPKLINGEKEKQVILVGTSAGAINTAIMAGAADLSADAIAERLCETWSNLSVDKKSSS